MHSDGKRGTWGHLSFLPVSLVMSLDKCHMSGGAVFFLVDASLCLPGVSILHTLASHSVEQVGSYSP